MLISELNLMNAGKSCWYGCGGKQGKCSWCGCDGWCCRKNGDVWPSNLQSNGCDGTFGGPTQHHCVLKPYSGLAAGKGRIIMKQVPILEAPSNSDRIKALNFLCEIKFNFRQERTRSSWPQVGGSWQISWFHMKYTTENFSICLIYDFLKPLKI